MVLRELTSNICQTHSISPTICHCNQPLQREHLHEIEAPEGKHVGVAALLCVSSNPLLLHERIVTCANGARKISALLPATGTNNRLLDVIFWGLIFARMDVFLNSRDLYISFLVLGRK